MKNRRLRKIIFGAIVAIISVISFVLLANRKKTYITNGGEY